MDGFTILASGYGAIEGPTYDGEGSIYFSDVFNGGVYRLGVEGEVETVVPRRKSVGGICLHVDGGIVISGRDLSRVVDGRSETVLAPGDLSPEEGRVSSFNDLGADIHGRIFAGAVRVDQQGAVVKSDLVMVTGPGQAVTIKSGIGLPNGVAMSPDSRFLYHADTYGKVINVIGLGVLPDAPQVVGCLSTSDLPGGPDGIAVDQDGGIWVALYEGGCIARLTPDGRTDQVIHVPAHSPLSVCFVGPDLSVLVVVTMDNTDRPELGGCVLRTTVGTCGTEVSRASI